MSNLEKKGSVFGGMLLISGSCIGAGMLALPILTGLSGFFPSLLMFFSAWAFMTLTALLVVEINGSFSKKVNFISMVEHTLGPWGKWVCWALYLFLFYALLVAYIAASGSLVSTFFQNFFQMQVKDWVGSLFFVILFGWVVYLGTRPVDLWNRLLMFGKIFAFVGIVFLGATHVKAEFLLRSAPQYAIFALPILVISFGFHNMIPSVTSYLKGDIKKVRLSILAGSLFALLIYLIWQIIVMGILPLEGKSGILETLKSGEEASQAVSGVLGISAVSFFANLLAFFAILPSFLAQSLTLTHFLSDGFKISYKKHETLTMCFVALMPPLIVSILYPQIFLKALNFAGGICTVVLFGILPVLMAWRARYKNSRTLPYQLIGGKSLLIAIFLFALFIAFFQISDMLGASYLPKIGAT